jgi:hypothetical protein
MAALVFLSASAPARIVPLYFGRKMNHIQSTYLIILILYVAVKVSMKKMLAQRGPHLWKPRKARLLQHLFLPAARACLQV